MDQDTDLNDLKNRILELESEVTFLEEQVDASYELENFRKKIETFAPEGEEIETIEKTKYGECYAKLVGYDTTQFNTAIHKLESKHSDEFNWSVIEAADGLGLEIWTTYPSV